MILLSFDFMDPPPVHTMLTALEPWTFIGSRWWRASDAAWKEDGWFPYGPTHGEGGDCFSCRSEEILSIAAMLSVQSFFLPATRSRISVFKKWLMQQDKYKRQENFELLFI